MYLHFTTIESGKSKYTYSTNTCLNNDADCKFWNILRYANATDFGCG